MNSTDFDEGFDDNHGWDDRCASAETETDSELECDPEPDPDELWLRTDDGSEEEPADLPPSPLQATHETLEESQTGEHGRGLRGKRKTDRRFIKGPLCEQWFVLASDLNKSAVVVGIALWQQAGFKKDDFFRAVRSESTQIRVDRGVKKRFEISPSQMSRGLHSLKNAGLIRFEKGGPGRCPVVRIVNVSIQQPTNRKKHNRIVDRSSNRAMLDVPETTTGGDLIDE